MTDSLGFVLARSQRFTSDLLHTVVGFDGDASSAKLMLQTGKDTEGITDLRIEMGNDVALVIEAKRWNDIPAREQLSKYSGWLGRNKATRKALVCLTGASDARVDACLSGPIDGVRVCHVSWKTIERLALYARSHEGLHEKRLLDEFCQYLRGQNEMDKMYSNMVFVVSLGTKTWPGWKLSQIGIVEKAGRYFFPVGNGWPDPPPNYVAFRYHGKLQSIHHVAAFETFTDPRAIFPDAPAEKKDPHYCLKLGPPIKPPHEVRTGPKVVRNARVYCMLDTLLTSATISDALATTKQRMGA
jgi:hypothetical protein